MNTIDNDGHLLILKELQIPLLGFEKLQKDNSSKFGERIKKLCGFISEKMKERETRLNENKEGFNILNCLTKYHLEELHSRILHYLLDPSADHGFGTMFLSLFLEVLAIGDITEATQAMRKLEVADRKKTTISIREMIAGEFGRMDIVVEIPGFVIVIENKIYARDQDEQVPRYVSYCEDRCRRERIEYMVLYLTPEGRSATQAESLHYYCISYRNHIKNWLSLCIEAVDKYPVVKIGLSHYLDLLNRKILFTPSNEIIMNIQNYLLEPENRIIIKYMREIHDALVPLRNHLRVQFFGYIVRLLEKEGYTFSPMRDIKTDISIQEIWEKQHGRLKLLNPEFLLKIDENREIRFFIEHDWDDVYYGLVPLENGIGQQHIWNDIKIEQLIEGLNIDMGWTLKGRDNCWFAWKTSNCFGDITFGDDRLNYELAENMHATASNFVKEVTDYLAALEKRLKETL